jgi:hypothetical protein
MRDREWFPTKEEKQKSAEYQTAKAPGRKEQGSAFRNVCEC